MVQVTDAAQSRGEAARWPRLLVLIAAAVELLGGLRDIPILFGNLSEVPGPGLGGAVIVAKIILQPILAFLALGFTIRGRMTDALLAMAALIAITWLSFLPSVALHGLDLSQGSGFIAALLAFQIYIAPVIALAVAVLALMRRWTPACFLAVLPTFLDLLGVLVFAVSVAIYGF